MLIFPNPVNPLGFLLSAPLLQELVNWCESRSIYLVVDEVYDDYIFEGEKHEYNPDLSIYFMDGHVEIWEIKPANQTQLPKNHAKWAACQHHCQARGWQFVVMTEVGIGKLKRRVDEITKS